jgi:hypothetical protein
MVGAERPKKEGVKTIDFSTNNFFRRIFADRNARKDPEYMCERLKSSVYLMFTRIQRVMGVKTFIYSRFCTRIRMEKNRNTTSERANARNSNFLKTFMTIIRDTHFKVQKIDFLGV